MGKPDKRQPEKEQEPLEDQILRRMLETPPRSHEEDKKGGKPKSGGHRKSAKG